MLETSCCFLCIDWDWSYDKYRSSERTHGRTFRSFIHYIKTMHMSGTLAGKGATMPHHLHCCIDLQPSSDFFPEGQSFGLEDPSGQYLFAGHLVGAETPFGQYDPSGQSTDEVAVGQ